MKNKQAQQMMMDCGSKDLKFIMLQKRIGIYCANKKKSGNYDPMIHLPIAADLAMKTMKGQLHKEAKSTTKVTESDDYPGVFMLELEI